MVHASERDRADVVAKRAAWSASQADMDRSALIFLDESGVNIAMTRRYGRAKNKQRVIDSAPLNTPKSTTIVSSIRLDGTQVPLHLSGALKGDSFLSYIRDNLVPTLHNQDIVIMDNLRCHKVEGVKDAIEKTGAHLLYVPPYSPDFNPIEMMWSKLKSILRKWKPRTVEALLDALPKAFAFVSINDISAWFTEAGYSHS